MPATIMAYSYAINVAAICQTRKSTSMDIDNYAEVGGPRPSERSIVTPTVLVDAPSPTTSMALQKRRRTSPRSARSKRRAPSHKEFRFFIDQRGRQHFNFRQRIWLEPSVEMAFTRVYSTALKTLAANLLALTICNDADQDGTEATFRNAVSLAPAFSRECLMGAPDWAWALPMATIESWLESKKRLRSRKARRRSD